MKRKQLPYKKVNSFFNEDVDPDIIGLSYWNFITNDFGSPWDHYHSRECDQDIRLRKRRLLLNSGLPEEYINSFM